jgi:hypothetical protein
MNPLLRYFPIEAILWTAALIALWVMDPTTSHFAICPIALAEFDWCPGCGLGRSINLFLHGEVRASLAQHPLGIFALILLSYRVIKLINTHLQTYGKSN